MFSYTQFVFRGSIWFCGETQPPVALRLGHGSCTYIRAFLLVGVEDDVGVAVVELAVLTPGPVNDLYI